MKYCYVKTKRTSSELIDFLKPYLTGRLIHVHLNDIIYIAICDIDLKGLYEHYEFDQYDEENDIQIIEIERTF